MDRIAIKERSKMLLKKNHWLCVGVAFLSTLTIGGIAGSGSSFFSTSIDSTTEIPSDANPFVDVEPALVIGVIAFAIIGLAFSYVAQVFLTNQFMVGSCRFFLKYRKNNPVDTGEVFQSYKDKTFLNIAKVTFIRDLFIGLWSLLFIVPGIIKSYDYWAVNYILAVKPDTPYDKALDLSKKMMQGHKMEVFTLGISFFGWYLLATLTCGFLAICYVNPYQSIALAELYSEIRQVAINRGIITDYDVPDYMEYQPQSPYNPYYNPQPSFYGAQPMNGGYYQQPMAQPYAQPVAYPTNAPVNGMYNPTAYPPAAQPVAYGQQPTQPQQMPVNYNTEPMGYNPAQTQQYAQPIDQPTAPTVVDTTAVVDTPAPAEAPSFTEPTIPQMPDEPDTAE